MLPWAGRREQVRRRRSAGLQPSSQSSGCGDGRDFGDVVLLLSSRQARPTSAKLRRIRRRRPARFTLGPPARLGHENRYDAAGGIIEVRGYDGFLPDGRLRPSTRPVARHYLTRNPGQAQHHAGLPGRQSRHFGRRAAHILCVRCHNRLAIVDPSGSIRRVRDAERGWQHAARPTLVEHTEAAIDAASTATTRQSGHPIRLRHGQSAALHRRCANSVAENEYDARGNVVTTAMATRPA
jgi:hypothetical protein